MEALRVITNKIPDFVLLPFLLELISLNLELVVEVLVLESVVDGIESDGIFYVQRGLAVGLGLVLEGFLFINWLNIFVPFKIQLLIDSIQKLILLNNPLILLSLVHHF
jgi:hypothetical protein